MKSKKLIYKNDAGTTIINWPLIPCMSHLEPEALCTAQITARNDVNYLTRRSGSVPVEVQKLVNTLNNEKIL